MSHFMIVFATLLWLCETWNDRHVDNVGGHLEYPNEPTWDFRGLLVCYSWHVYWYFHVLVMDIVLYWLHLYKRFHPCIGKNCIPWPFLKESWAPSWILKSLIVIISQNGLCTLHKHKRWRFILHSYDILDTFSLLSEHLKSSTLLDTILNISKSIYGILEDF